MPVMDELQEATSKTTVPRAATHADVIAAASTVATLSAIADAAEKAYLEARVALDKLESHCRLSSRNAGEARNRLVDLAELLDAGLSAPPTPPDETFDGAGAPASPMGTSTEVRS